MLNGLEPQKESCGPLELYGSGTERELWTIRAVWKWDRNLDQNNVPQEDIIPERMKIVLQLFSTSPNHYLVDIKFDGWEPNDPNSDKAYETREVTPSAETIAHEEKVSTFSAYPFLNLTTKLINELVRENEISVEPVSYSSPEDLQN